MSLKSKGEENNNKMANELNLIGVGTFVEGTVETKGSLRIDGRVKGAVKTGKLSLLVGRERSPEKSRPGWRWSVAKLKAISGWKRNWCWKPIRS